MYFRNTRISRPASPWRIQAIPRMRITRPAVIAAALASLSSSWK
jgi:hypothetical protein